MALCCLAQQNLSASTLFNFRLNRAEKVGLFLPCSSEDDVFSPMKMKSEVTLHP